LEVELDSRPPESVEIAAYYVVSETLTNAAKHAHASHILVSVRASGATLRAEIEDDGIGGAEASTGSGLVGLIDRVEALGGRFALDSPPGEGTRIAIELPLIAQNPSERARLTGQRGSSLDGASLGSMALADVADADTLLAAVASVADALYVVDARGRTRYVSATALEILGYEEPGQLVGRTSHDTIHHSRPDGTPFPAAECPLLRPRLTGEAVRVDEDWFVRQDGSFVPVSYSSAPVSLADGRGAVVAFRERRLRQPDR
jgi:PAS domain S-box-containing protein